MSFANFHGNSDVVHRVRDMLQPQCRALLADGQVDQRRQHPAVDRGIPFKDVLGERARLTLWLLMGAAAFVMIISAANVVNLTLMRGVRREHELVLGVARGACFVGVEDREVLPEDLLLTVAL